MKRIKTFEELFEGIRHSREKIPIANHSFAYHWLTEGNLFDQIYKETTRSDVQKFILRKSGGVTIEMPPLPPTQFNLGGEGGHGVCLTLDPEYESAGYTGEAFICLVFDLKKLSEKFDIEDLTDNGEAEIRIKQIPDFDKYLSKILITRKCYEKGEGWEGFYYRPVREWLPESIKGIVEVLPSVRSISTALKKLNKD